MSLFSPYSMVPLVASLHTKLQSLHSAPLLPTPVALHAAMSPTKLFPHTWHGPPHHTPSQKACWNTQHVCHCGVCSSSSSPPSPSLPSHLISQGMCVRGGGRSEQWLPAPKWKKRPPSSRQTYTLHGATQVEAGGWNVLCLPHTYHLQSLPITRNRKEKACPTISIPTYREQEQEVELLLTFPPHTQNRTPFLPVPYKNMGGTFLGMLSHRHLHGDGRRRRESKMMHGMPANGSSILHPLA